MNGLRVTRLKRLYIAERRFDTNMPVGVVSTSTTHSDPKWDPTETEPNLQDANSWLNVLAPDAASPIRSPSESGYLTIRDTNLASLLSAGGAPRELGHIPVVDRRKPPEVGPNGGDRTPEGTHWRLAVMAFVVNGWINRFLAATFRPRPTIVPFRQRVLMNLGFAGATNTRGIIGDTLLLEDKALRDADLRAAVSRLAILTLPQFVSAGDKEGVHSAALATGLLLELQCLIDALYEQGSLEWLVGAMRLRLESADPPLPTVNLIGPQIGAQVLSVEQLNAVVAKLREILSVDTGLTSNVLARLPYHNPNAGGCDELGFNALFGTFGFFVLKFGARAALERMTYRALLLVGRALLEGTAQQLVAQVEEQCAETLTVSKLTEGLFLPSRVSLDDLRRDHGHNPNQVKAAANRKIEESLATMKADLPPAVSSRVALAIASVVDKALAGGGWESLPVDLELAAAKLESRARDLETEAAPYMRSLDDFVKAEPESWAEASDDEDDSHGLLGRLTGLLRRRPAEDEEGEGGEEAEGGTGAFYEQIRQALEQKPQAQLKSIVAGALKDNAQDLRLLATGVRNVVHQLRPTLAKGSPLELRANPRHWEPEVSRVIPNALDIASKEGDAKIYFEVARHSFAKVGPGGDLVPDKEAISRELLAMTGLRNLFVRSNGPELVIEALLAPLSKPFAAELREMTISRYLEEYGDGLERDLPGLLEVVAPFLGGFCPYVTDSSGRLPTVSTFLEYPATDTAGAVIEQIVRSEVSTELDGGVAAAERGDPQIIVLRMISNLTFNDIAATRVPNEVGVGGPGFQALGHDLTRYEKERARFPLTNQRYRNLILDTHPEVAAKLGLRRNYDEPDPPQKPLPPGPPAATDGGDYVI